MQCFGADKARIRGTQEAQKRRKEAKMQTETKPSVSMDPRESLGSLLGDLMKHSTALIKGEIALVRSELRSKIDIFRTAAVFTDRKSVV